MKDSRKMPGIDDKSTPTQKRVEESNLIFRALADHAGDAIVIADLEGKVVYANHAEYELLGYDYEKRELDGVPMSALAPEQERARQAEVVGQMMATGGSWSAEATVARKDGSIRDVAITSFPIFDEHDRPASIGTFLRDITERKLAEARLQTIFENAPEAIVIVDLTTGLFTESNENAVKLYGLSHEELVKVGPADMSPPVQPDGRLSTEKALEKINAARQGETPVFEWIHRNARGEDFPCEIRLVRLPGNLPLVRASVTDITERKRTEASQKKYQELFLSSRDGIASISMEGNILECNAAFEALVGYTQAELKQMRFTDLTPEKWQAMESEILTTQVLPNGYAEPYQKEYIHKDGHIFPVELAIYLTRSADGNPTGFWGFIRDITERKQAEAELNSQVSILDNSRDFIATVDMQGVQIYVNLAGARMLGYDDPRELIGKRIKNMHSPEDTLRVEQEGIPTAMREGIWRGENRLLRLDGTSLPVDQSIFVIRDAQGQPQAVATIMVDITERQRTEQALRESEEKFKTLADSLVVGVFVHQDGILKYLGREAARVLGYSDSTEVIGHPMMDLVHPDERPRIADISRRRVAGESVPNSYETRLIRKDGTGIDVDMYSALITYEGRTATQGAFLDITERKQADEALQSSRQNLRTIFDSVYDALFIHDLDGSIIDVNEQMLKMYKVEREQARTYSIIEDYSAPGDSLIDLPKTWQEVINGKTAIFDWKSRRPGDGSVFDTEVVLRKVSRDGREVILANVRDITERKRAEESIRKNEARLKEAEEVGNVGSWDYDMTTDTLTWSDYTYRIYGRDPATFEVTFNNVVTHYPPGDKEAVLEAFQKTIQNRTELIIEHRIITGNNETRFVFERGRVTYSADGTPLRMIGSVADITERKQAEAQVERTLRETRMRYEVSQALAGAQTEEAVLDVLEQEAGRFYPEAMVMLVTFDRQGKDATLVLRRGNGFESGMVFNTPLGLRFPAERFPVVNLLSPDKPFITNDFLADHERFSDPAALEAVRRLGAASIAYFPLTIGSEWMGFVNVVVKSAGYFDETKQHLYQMLAELGAVALQTAHLRDQIQDAMTRRGYQVQISTEISQEVASAPELNDLFGRVVTLTKERLGYYHTQLFRYDPAQDAVVLINGYGETGQKMLAGGHKLPMGSGLIGTAAASGQTVLRSTLAEDPDWQPNPLLPDTQGEIAVPIKFQSNVLGVLDAQSNRAGAITEDDRLLLEGLCGQVAVAIEQTRLRQEMAERLEEVNRLYRSMSREGWKTYRETADLPTGFMFDQTGTRPVDEAGLADELFANIPMKVPGGEVVGTLAIADDPQHPTSPEDYAFLQQVSDQIALALESARLSAQTQSALAQTERLSEAGLRFARSADLQELLVVVNEMLGIPVVNRTLLGVFNYSSTGELEGMDIVANWWDGSGHEPSEIGRHYSMETLNIMPLFISDTTVFYSDTFHDERVTGATLELFTRQNIRSMAVLPLYLGSQQSGVLFLEAEEPHTFTPGETYLFSAVGPQISTVLENRRQFDRAKQQAERESTLNVISQKIQSATTVEAVLQIAARELGHALGAPMTIAQLSMKDKK